MQEGKSSENSYFSGIPTQITISKRFFVLDIRHINNDEDEDMFHAFLCRIHFRISTQCDSCKTCCYK